MNNQNQNVLDDDRIGRLLLKLSLPTFFGMFVMTLYNVVDTIFIGHYVGPMGIAGLSIVFPLQMLSIAIGEMTGMGGASLISRSIGTGDLAKAERTLGNALTVNIVLSAIMMAAGLANPDFWLRLMGSSETILPYARDFMTIILIGTVFSTLAMALNSLIRAEGNARVPMTGMIIGAVTNVILCAIFIIPLDMGVRGSALATVIAQLISVLYFMSFYFSGKSFLKIHLQNLAFQWDILKGILSIGIASFVRLMAASLSAIFVNRMLITYGGDMAISTFGIINRIMMFAIMPGIAIGGGLQPILGFNYGAKRYDRAIRAIIFAMGAATACGLVVFGIVYFAPEPFIRIFTNDAGLIALGSYAAKRVFLALYMIGFIMVGSLVFQSIGKAVQSFVTAISRPFLFLIPLVLILPQFLGLEGVWLSFPIADGLTLLLTLMLLIPQIRELRRKDRLVRGRLIEP
ncbi:MAG: MATE family efflux transporter [Dehalococcoidales bacterium]|nr:MATE family efflux transporter [Dehalococcoidales bacterium]